MHVPAPLPDELLDGYVGRVAVLNQHASRQETLARMRAAFATRRFRTESLSTSLVVG